MNSLREISERWDNRYDVIKSKNSSSSQGIKCFNNPLQLLWHKAWGNVVILADSTAGKTYYVDRSQLKDLLKKHHTSNDSIRHAKTSSQWAALISNVVDSEEYTAKVTKSKSFDFMQ